ncbi:hypothetical protein B0J14DRAFT_678386 [Halenospora varia]|nr:hypothetical protein B0J14DRAFT_678386 [Halenospora varia]
MSSSFPRYLLMKVVEQEDSPKCDSGKPLRFHYVRFDVDQKSMEVSSFSHSYSGSPIFLPPYDESGASLDSDWDWIRYSAPNHLSPRSKSIWRTQGEAFTVFLIEVVGDIEDQSIPTTSKSDMPHVCLPATFWETRDFCMPWNEGYLIGKSKEELQHMASVGLLIYFVFGIRVWQKFTGKRLGELGSKSGFVDIRLSTSSSLRMVSSLRCKNIINLGSPICSGPAINGHRFASVFEKEPPRWYDREQRRKTDEAAEQSEDEGARRLSRSAASYTLQWDPTFEQNGTKKDAAHLSKENPRQNANALRQRATFYVPSRGPCLPSCGVETVRINLRGAAWKPGVEEVCIGKFHFLIGLIKLCGILTNRE